MRDSLSLVATTELSSLSLSLCRLHRSSSRFRAYKVSRGNRGSYYYPYTSSLFPRECMVHIRPLSLSFSLSFAPAFVKETSPSETAFSAWQRDSRAHCDFYSSHFTSVFLVLRPPSAISSTPALSSLAFPPQSSSLSVPLSFIAHRTRNTN